MLGFIVGPQNTFVVTPTSQDSLTLKLETPPVKSLGGQVTIEFKVRPSGIYNGTRCAKFNPIIVFDEQDWDKPQQVNVSFVDYGCCIYSILGHGGGYEWEYTGPEGIFVFGCHERAGNDCKERKCVL
jgi:hypothetical protein